MKEIIKSDNAPAAVGPYSIAVKSGGMVFTAGQLGIDPETNKMVDGGVEAQAVQAFENLKEVLSASGAALTDVVKVTVFLNKMSDFQTVNGIYARYFTSDFPARSAVEVSALPLGAEVEMEAIAVL